MAWRFELLNKPYGGITEGPVWDGEAVYFTHISNHRIMRYDPGSGVITQAREGTNHTNGLCHDAQGRTYGCCSGRYRLESSPVSDGYPARAQLPGT